MNNSRYQAVSCLIGAGYSFVAGLPLARNLLTTDVVALSKRALRNYRAVWTDFNKWLEVNPDGYPEQYLSELFQGRRNWSAPPFSHAIGLITAVLATPRGADVKSVNPRYSVRVIQPSRCPAHVDFWACIVDAFDRIFALTTNYDLLVERALRHRPMKRGFGPGCYYGGLEQPQILKGTPLPFSVSAQMREVELHGRIPVFKLHGSLNWSYKSGRLELYQDMRPAFRGSGDAAIVPPVPYKDIPQWLASVWMEAEKALAGSDTWVVCGYSLPSYDHAIESLLSKASSGRLTRIILISPNSSELAGRYIKIAPRADMICLPGLPEGLEQLVSVLR